MRLISNPYYYFYSVVLHGGFRKAAERLFIAESSVSKQISSLENELGYKLFDRHNNKFNLTPAGHELFRLLQLINALTSDYQNRKSVKNDSSAISGEVHIGIVNGWNPSLFKIPIFESLNSNGVNLRILYERMSYFELSEALNRDALDFALLPVEEVRHHENLSYVFLFRINSRIVISKSNPFAVEEDITSRLKDLRLYIHPNISDGLPATLERLKSAGISWKECVVVPNIDSMMLAIEQNDGFTIMAECSDCCQKANVKVYNSNNYQDIVLAHKNKTVYSPLHKYVLYTLG